MLTLDIKKQLYGANGHFDLAVNMHIKKGEFVALMGQSGSGKTTLLRVLAGLETMEGEIVVEGKSWKDLPPQQREIGFVFQDYALFENMTVEENLLFVHPDKQLAKELLEITELTGLSSCNVTGLSGGQKQRVSLCRALMNKPKLLLMDEPLSALDARMRTKLQEEILALHNRLEMTTIIVSHDINEIFNVASRVWLLQDGKIVKDGTANEVMQNEMEYGAKFEAKVLRVDQKNNTYLATVHLTGKVLEVEVDASVAVGDTLRLSLQVEG